jgi:DNA-binding MarR family transcriptional regulator
LRPKLIFHRWAAADTTPTLCKLADRMVSDGLVHRQVAAQEHRQVNLLPTDLGRKRMHQVREDVEATDRTFAGVQDGEDGMLLASLLSRLAD